MYRVHKRAVLVTILLQLTLGFLWITAAPGANSGENLLEIAKTSSVSQSLILLALASALYTSFCAWLLARMRVHNGFSGMFTILFSWLFTVIPNFLFVSVLHDFSHEKMGYLLGYGAACALCCAFILPFWRSTRSIFKD